MTTNNHPANGPVSLARLHQIREHLQHDTQYSNGGNRAYILADVLKVIDVAIATFGAAPVLYAAEETLAYAKMGELHLKCLSQPMGDAVIPLYRNAQSAPASVPDDVLDALQKVARIRLDLNDFDGDRRGIADCLGDAEEALIEVVNHRAAMLQAEPVTTANKLPAEAAYGYFAFNDHHGEEFFKKREDAIAFCKEAIEEYRQENAEEGCDPDEVRRTCWGVIIQEGTDIEVDNEGHIDYALTPELAGNSPVTPDTWIPVSERMPEVGVKVLCFPVEDEPIHAIFNGQLWLQDISWSSSDEPIDNVIPCNVTHWMPLPAAPQQEVK